MSAGGPAGVRAAIFSDFWSQAVAYTEDPSRDITTTLSINETDHADWTFFSREFVSDGESGRYDIILRRPVNVDIGTAEYVRVWFAGDGERVSFVQSVVIQNDKDYIGRGHDRFDALED